MTLVDSCVLIDLIENDPVWSDWSAQALDQASARGPLAINMVIYAEIAKSFADIKVLDHFVSDIGIQVQAVPLQASFHAAHAHLAYRRNKGHSGQTLPDFFIGAHAVINHYPLLTRDRRRFSTYFPDLQLITPE